MAGRPPDVTDKEILQVFRESSDLVLFTGEIAEELPIGGNGTRKRLKELEEKGFVESKQRGKTIVWWLTDHGRDYLSNQ